MTSSLSTEDIASRVDAELHALLENRDMQLYKMVSYHLGWKDAIGNEVGPPNASRTHGVACLVTCLALEGNIDIAVRAATAVELINCLSEIHDDVQSGRPSRDNRDAVWWIWGPAQAINVGDGMHALARMVMFTLKDSGLSEETTLKAVQMLDVASLKMCEGRFQDLEAQERIDITIEDYMDMATAKTGALYSCAMKLGALISGANQPIINSMGMCGTKLGLAKQIQSDIFELWGGSADKSAFAPEVLNKKKLLPIVYALSQSSLSQKRQFGDIYFKRVLDPGDISSLTQVLDELGARNYCEEEINKLRNQAIDSVTKSAASDEAKHALGQLANSML